ncbi:MAG: hypothetical protein HC804_02790, partial [Anaerolineae bacterium]|nr:hypothetical protein [Anaerolineae bacterium]
FNRLYVYVPVGLITAVVLTLSLYLLYLALFPPTAETYLFLSGLADFVLILMLIPVVLIFGVTMTASLVAPFTTTISWTRLTNRCHPHHPTAVCVPSYGA